MLWAESDGGGADKVAQRRGVTVHRRGGAEKRWCNRDGFYFPSRGQARGSLSIHWG